MKTAGIICAADRAELAAWLRMKTLPQVLGMRARGVLLSVEGHSLRKIATRLGVIQRTVCLWRRRNQGEGLAGLKSRHRSGRPRRSSRHKELAVVATTLRPPNPGGNNPGPLEG
jgi:Winged helix-turn helix